MRWSLENLYKSFDSHEFKRDNDMVVSLISEIKSWIKENLTSSQNAKEKMEYYIKFHNTLGDMIYKIMAYSELSLSVNAKDEKALHAVEKIENIVTEMTEPDVVFKWWRY